ncbi:MAG: tRNA pseudouridine(55) synthase TruB [Candidatus Omnitrophica bacterium]|nr:tRNA pseudouridine(55) synthase TruB [Candidatus Omnitrophota bacterium]
MQQQTQEKKDGILLIHKPRGITSHDAVDIIRKKLKTRKVGHAGTLDPLAEGLLIVLVGACTKLFPKFVKFDKEYLGILKLGEKTYSGDSQGHILEKKDFSGLSKEDIEKVFSSFKGPSEQIPPMVSAIRQKGKRLYNLARKGLEVERKARSINIFSLDIIKIDMPFVEFKVHCSKGTYVRKLAEDIGEKLGCGAHMTKILRLGVGHYKLSDSVGLEEVAAKDLKPANL